MQQAQDHRRSTMKDAMVAVRNTFKLGSSLMLTWVIGLAARVLLPRYLGPQQFGELNFADAFTGTAFVFIGLGLDTYIRKEVAVRHEHASEFFGGILVIQAAITLLVFGVVAAILHATNRSRELSWIVFSFGVAQVIVCLNGTFAAMLHATGTVNRLAVASVVSKVLWAAGIVVGFRLGHPVMAIPVSLYLTEAGKMALLWSLVRKRLDLRFRVDFAVARKVIVACLPFYLGGIAVVAASRVDVSLLEFLLSDPREIGWYGAASTLARLGLILTPLLQWVLMPLFARASARSEEELRVAISRSMELVLTLAMPISLLLSVGADVWVKVMFGSAYEPAALSLRLLAPVFVMTYIATVSSTCLQLMDRGWTATYVTIAGTVVDGALNLLFIPRVALLGGGPGYAGAASALAAMLTELLVMVLLTLALKGRVFDRRVLDVTFRTLGVCAAVVAIDRLSVPLGAARVLVDAVAYVVLAFAVKAVRWQEVRGFVQAAMRRGEPEPALAPAVAGESLRAGE